MDELESKLEKLTDKSKEQIHLLNEKLKAKNQEMTDSTKEIIKKGNRLSLPQPL